MLYTGTMTPTFSVTELHEMLNMHLALLGEITIEGEISELKPSGTQWLYVTIKDASSVIKLFGTQWEINNWKSLEVGMKVHVSGVARTYAPYGTLSISVSRIVPAGEGAHKQAFEKLKKQLETEGLFDQSRKRELPAFPQKIGLITAKNSQAYNDFVKVLAHRMGGIKILFAPVLVQGEVAPALICKAIQYFNREHVDLDALIICRGGGSQEDLQAFNDESVARAIFASAIPTITGVGHEGDTTLADLVADVRASTPSNAAELLVREREAMIQHIHMLTMRMDRAVSTVLTTQKHIAQSAQSRLAHALMTTIHHTRMRIDAFYATQTVLQSRLTQAHEHTSSLTRLLQSLDPLTILAKGFSITRRADGGLVRSIKDAPAGTAIETRVQDGTIYAEVQAQPAKPQH